MYIILKKTGILESGMVIRNTNQRGNIYYIVDHPPGKFCYGAGMICYVVNPSPGDNLLYSGISGGKVCYVVDLLGGMFCYIVDHPGGRSARGKVHYMTPDRLLSDYKPAMIGGRRGQVDRSDLREIKVQQHYALKLQCTSKNNV